MRTIDVMVHDVVTVHPDTDGCGSNRGPISEAATSRSAPALLAESVPGVARAADEMIPAY